MVANLMYRFMPASVQTSYKIAHLAAGTWFLIVSSLLCGCMPYIQSVEQKSNSAATLLPDKFITSDGETLPLKVWSATALPAAIILGIHGFNDYRNAFASIGPYLANQGITFYAYDQRGFGATRHRGVWPSAAALRADASAIVQELRNKHTGVPIYLLGDSMGGAVVITAAASDKSPPVDGIILNAPAVWGGQTFSLFYRVSLWAMAHTLPWMTLGKSGVSIVLTDNRALVMQLRADPLMIRETRVDVLYGLVGLMDEALDKASQIKVRTLLLYGLRDQLIPKISICHIAARMQQPTTTLFYPNGYHLLLRDLQAPKVWADIVTWVRTPGLSTSPLPAECTNQVLNLG